MLIKVTFSSMPYGTSLGSNLINPSDLDKLVRSPEPLSGTNLAFNKPFVQLVFTPRKRVREPSIAMTSSKKTSTFGIGNPNDFFNQGLK